MRGGADRHCASVIEPRGPLRTTQLKRASQAADDATKLSIEAKVGS
jgi:hypothetical protein